MVFWKYLILTAICFIYVKSQGTNTEEITDIATLDANMTEVPNDLHKVMPDTLVFTLNAMNNSQPIKLNLKRTRTIKENSFVFVVRQDKKGNPILVKENVPVEKNVGLYQDNTTGAAFTVRCEGLHNGLCNPVLFGSIHIDNIEYDLTEISSLEEINNATESQLLRQKRRANREKERDKHSRRLYSLKKRKRTRGFVDDYKTFEQPDTNSNLIKKEISQPVGMALPLTVSENIVDVSKDKFPVLGRTMVSTSRTREVVAADDTYNVELLLVIDYSIYLREYNAIQDGSVSNKDMEAKSRIRQYFAHVVNGMNLRYNNIETTKFHINVAVSGYIIADKPEIAVWTSRRGDRELVDADDAIDSLRNWRMSISELPEHDHMMLFTWHDLYRYRRSDNKVTGLASFKAMCSSSSVSVVEDNGVHGSISTGTHELAHSLGASHDGTGSNICSSNEQFIMAVTGGVTNSVNELNPWKFSPCSIDELDKFLKNLPIDNCLKDEALIYDMDEFNEVTRNEAGQIYDPNEQCRQRVGKNSYYGWGGGLGEYNEICTSMACKSDTSENSYLIYTAARGTSCGNNRWCIDGVCKTDPRAPEKDEACVHGDSQRSFEGQNCSQLIRADPSKCYENYYRDFCCQTCKDIARSTPGCEYGDKTSYCSSTLSKPHLCYSERNQDLCCETCQSLYTGYSGCEYGDKIHEITSRSCSQWRCSGNPDYQKACCKTCGLIPDTPIAARTTKSIRTSQHTTPKPTAKPTTKPPPPVITTKLPVRPTVPTLPMTTTRRTTASVELCLIPGANFGSMTCELVARWMSNICSSFVLKKACCEPCKPKVLIAATEEKCEDLDICSNVQGFHCYDNFVRDRCCSTCKSLETVDKDCMYGDKSDSCSRYVKLWPDYVCKQHADKCCDSCKNSSKSTVTILSSRMENNIAKTLDSGSKSPFSNIINGESLNTDLPTRGDQTPIDEGSNKKGKGRGKGKNQEKDKKQRPGYSNGKDSTKSVVWHISVHRRPRVSRLLHPFLMRIL